MKIHEYQAKALLARFGVRVPEQRVATSPEQAEQAARELGGRVVVKAQIHAGGRGKAGGVKVVDGPEQAGQVAGELLGRPLITRQTGPAGQPVDKLLIEPALDIVQEFYAGLVLDREQAQVALIASAEGGVEIEEVAARSPEAIHRVHASPLNGLMAWQVRGVGFAMGLDKGQVNQLVELCGGLYRTLMHLDASLVEINPLVLTGDGDLLALDAKMNIDDNALYRHPDVRELRDESQEEPAEVEASRHNLSYVRLDGDIGCMVNGAGLAMATMDIIKLFGGEPANFLDVGGGTDAKRVEAAFKIILSDPNVRAVLVNIFGGIVRCDVIAEGVVEAVGQVGIEVPLVVRLQGTKMEEGREILRSSGLDIVPAETMKDAAEAVVAAAGRSS